MSNQPPPPTLPGKKSSALPDVRWICYFTVGFTGYLFATKPVNTTAQLIFRLALLATAMAGLVVIWWRRKKSKS